MNTTSHDKYALTIREASAYFNIGIKKLYMLAADHSEPDDFALRNGRQYLIIRELFEEFLRNTSSI